MSCAVGVFPHRSVGPRRVRSDFKTETNFESFKLFFLNVYVHCGFVRRKSSLGNGNIKWLSKNRSPADRDHWVYVVMQCLSALTHTHAHIDRFVAGTFVIVISDDRAHADPVGTGEMRVIRYY